MMHVQMLHERIKYEQQHTPAAPVQGSQPEPHTEHKSKKRKTDKAAPAAAPQVKQCVKHGIFVTL
jgi:hypothetical protein